MDSTMRWMVGLGMAGAMWGTLLLGGVSRRNAAMAQATMKKAKGITDASGVMYFSNDENAAALKENLVLDDQIPQKNYRVAIYHRDKGGEVEIYKKDTDVFYIVEGSATFVTGGTITNGKETAPDEIRVPTMSGGTERKIGKGDVIMIPANVTHWYKEVQQPITYFGVKVR